MSQIIVKFNKKQYQPLREISLTNEGVGSTEQILMLPG